MTLPSAPYSPTVPYRRLLSPILDFLPSRQISPSLPFSLPGFLLAAVTDVHTTYKRERKVARHPLFLLTFLHKGTRSLAVHVTERGVAMTKRNQRNCSKQSGKAPSSYGQQRTSPKHPRALEHPKAERHECILKNKTAHRLQNKRSKTTVKAIPSSHTENVAPQTSHRVGR